MPSLASYRRRKAEVAYLTDEVDRLSRDIHYMKRYLEDLERALKNTNLLRQQVEVMLRVWQQYVADHYMMELPKTILIKKDGKLELADTPITEIPVCIKPKDCTTYVFRNVPEYIRKAMENGPDHLPQILS
jgi:hypothetical protein